MPTAPDEAATTPDRSLKLEIFLAIGLGLAAVVTATASFQSALVEDEMIAGFNRGIKAVDEGGQAFSEAQQILSRDQALYIEYNKANFEEQYTLSTYILTSLMDPNLREAVEWWRDVSKNARTPFDEGSPYQLPALDRWESLKQEAGDQFEAANEADETTDRYDFITVLAAVVLFFFGLASVVRSPGIRQTFSAMGAVILVVSIVLLVLVETA
ncbi:MAG: hypothetical protein ACRDHM_04975 [Actinomycetota bacterium]